MSDVKANELADQWLEKWPESLSLWSRFPRLKAPIFCRNSEEEKREGLTGSFAMIRLTDHAVVLSLMQIEDLGLQEFPLEIMGHEIGHHIYCPADLTDMGRMIARMQRSLPGKKHLAGLVGNLYGDLLINDRLFREHGLRLDQIYKKLRKAKADKLWDFYMRIYELLWALPAGSLTSGEIAAEMEGDAQLGYRLIRNYARDWLKGSGRFAALCLPYLLEDEGAETQKALGGWLDTSSPGDGETFPEGLTGVDADEVSGAVHPSLDGKAIPNGSEPVAQEGSSNGGNSREPFEYGQILRSLGLNLDDRDIAVRYYRERAIPYLIPFPTVEKERSQDPLPEGFSAWDLGSPLEEIDWIATAVKSPIPIPGYTILEQVSGFSEGEDPQKDPIDLDLYVDCSGSMPDPAVMISYLTLAGTVIALSALRAGSRVQATLWSGTGQFETTGDFVRDEKKILRVLAGYLGGGTAFPIHVLRDTYQNRKPTDRKAHILVISDDGVTTMFDTDERGRSGREVAKEALQKAGGGGTFILNLYFDWKDDPLLADAASMGWDISTITDWESLLDFSRNFAKKHYQKERSHGR